MKPYCTCHIACQSVWVLISKQPPLLRSFDPRFSWSSKGTNDSDNDSSSFNIQHFKSRTNNQYEDLNKPIIESKHSNFFLTFGQQTQGLVWLMGRGGGKQWTWKWRNASWLIGIFKEERETFLSHGNKIPTFHVKEKHRGYGKVFDFPCTKVCSIGAFRLVSYNTVGMQNRPLYWAYQDYQHSSGTRSNTGIANLA